MTLEPQAGDPKAFAFAPLPAGGHDHHPCVHRIIGRDGHGVTVTGPGKGAAAQTQINDIRLTPHKGRIRTVVNAGNDVRGESISVFIENLDGN